MVAMESVTTSDMLLILTGVVAFSGEYELQQYQREFIECAIALNALRFGEFTLKSGRISPYFFNAGAFSSGAALALLGRSYAAAIVESKVQYDVLMGPAYKGIPLVAATSVALFSDHDIDANYVFNRKEAKTHGEGGTLVGADLKGKVLVIDDVITAGTAIREVMGLLQDHSATCAGVLIGLDRQERGQGELSAVQEVEREYGVPVLNIVGLDDIVAYVEESDAAIASYLGAMLQYREQYGVD